MSVVVFGMEMPEHCGECGIEFCVKWINHDATTRPKDCPLRHLPEKHGRLVDVDEAYDRIMEQEGGYYIDMDGVGMGLEECRTIVEAEGD